MSSDEVVDRTYLGFDLSTQQLKAVVVNDNLCILKETAVKFDTEIPEFRTRGGVREAKDRCTVVAPVLMWVKAFDLVLDKLRVCGVDFSKVAAISGCAQQHGSVYWNKGALAKLQGLQSDKFLHTQLADGFVVKEGPVWMDSSTEKWCQQYDNAAGDKKKLAELTGSRAYERFTGPQILKLEDTNPTAYNATERISLVSSFACSLFLGKYADIDYADGSGMNLMNIKTKTWDENVLKVHSPSLAEKLGTPVPSYSNLGPISSYFVERFGFDPLCSVIAFTGDNPASLIGMLVCPGDVVVSLGTSDTVFTWLSEPSVTLEGHVMCNPIDKDAYMAMICFKNGSLTRERVRDLVSEGDWDIFNELVNSVPRGNFGNVGLYFDLPEIRPAVCGDYRYNKEGEQLPRFTSREVEARAVLEGQCIAKRYHLMELGINMDEISRVLATGGASKNDTLVQILADTWNAPVYVLDSSDSAVLGAAYQAKHGLMFGQQSFQEITQHCPSLELAAEPFPDSNEVYGPMLMRYNVIVDSIQSKLRATQGRPT